MIASAFGKIIVIAIFPWAGGCVQVCIRIRPLGAMVLKRCHNHEVLGDGVRSASQPLAVRRCDCVSDWRVAPSAR